MTASEWEPEKKGTPTPCPCAAGATGDYEGPLRSCPVHGETAEETIARLEKEKAILQRQRIVWMEAHDDIKRENVRLRKQSDEREDLLTALRAVMEALETHMGNTRLMRAQADSRLCAATCTKELEEGEAAMSSARAVLAKADSHQIGGAAGEGETA